MRNKWFRKHKRKLIVFAVMIVGWVLYAPYCLTFAMSDADAKKEFDSLGIVVTMRTLAIQKHHLHFVMTGDADKPTLIFVHGTPGGWSAFKEYLQDTDLLHHYRLISIDRPGFGGSDFGHAIHLGDQAEIIGAMMDMLNNNQPFYLAGHSMGEPLVVKLAALKPALVKGIVIIAGSIDANEEPPNWWRPLIFKTPLNLLVPGSLRPSNIEQYYLKKDLVQLRKDFPKVTCSVYMLHGTKDNLVPYGNMMWGEKMFMHATCLQTTTIPGANHFLPWQHYSEIKKVLLTMK